MVTIMTQPQAYGVASPLRARGYTVLPTPQQVELAPGDVKLDDAWQIAPQDLPKDDMAVITLSKGLREKAGLNLTIADRPDRVIRLAVQPGTVDPRLDDGRARQAYLLAISDKRIDITGNASAGLFYGVQTLLQLVKRDPVGGWIVPKCTIRDWPALELRICHWDTKHHQDRIETLKRYLDWYAAFKINAVCFELEDKFAYPSHPVIGQAGRVHTGAASAT